ncbi:hypothetical protein ADMFC3_21440 [Geovibrio sp. ADMFC3]
MINSLLCKKTDTIISVMKIINDNAMGIVFVTDGNGKLCGVITDGDIRRALINNVGFDEAVEGLISPSYVFGKINEDYASLLSKISGKVKIIPLIDEQGCVVDFFEYKQNIFFPVAIPNLGGNEFKYLFDAFMSTWISSSGKYIGMFEKNFAGYCDCSFGVAISNGTVALHLALVALGIGEGDEVIVPDLTFAATINTVIHANATPVIVDVDRESWCIDPEAIEKAITPQTKAIIPVHLYGQACDMDRIMEIARKHSLKVIEDCAEAHGAMFKDKKVGSFGDIGCFSFFGNKVITTGEGGMCVTNDPELEARMRVLKDHGMSKTKRYWHDIVGYNYRMTNLQAAIGVAQLERVEEIHKNRKLYEASYKEVLDNSIFSFQKDLPERKRITWLVSVLLDESLNRDDYMAKLKENGIDARPFFYPLSDMEVYKPYCRFETPVTKMLSKQGLNLPTYESLKSIKELKSIISAMK